MRVAIFDDDLLTRWGARSVIAGTDDITESAINTVDEALALTSQELGRFDCVVVDVHDQAREVREVGTDIYTGIAIIGRIRSLGMDTRILAITPTRANPLLTERLIRSGADYLYERWEFQHPEDLVEALLRPDEGHRPLGHPAHVLSEEGLGQRGDPNAAVDAYKSSTLYGRVRPGLTQAAIGPRRAALSLRDAVIDTGFVGTGARPRWNEVRDYLLKLSGRLPVEPRTPPIARSPSAPPPSGGLRVP